MKVYMGNFKKLENALKKYNDIILGFKNQYEDIREEVYPSEYSASKYSDLFVQNHFIGRIYLTQNYDRYKIQVV